MIKQPSEAWRKARKPVTFLIAIGAMVLVAFIAIPYIPIGGSSSGGKPTKEADAFLTWNWIKYWGPDGYNVKNMFSLPGHDSYTIDDLKPCDVILTSPQMFAFLDDLNWTSVGFGLNDDGSVKKVAVVFSNAAFPIQGTNTNGTVILIDVYNSFYPDYIVLFNLANFNAAGAVLYGWKVIYQ